MLTRESVFQKHPPAQGSCPARPINYSAPMATYKIIGANAESGVETEILVEAETPSLAEWVARERGTRGSCFESCVTY